MCSIPCLQQRYISGRKGFGLEYLIGWGLLQLFTVGFSLHKLVLHKLLLHKLAILWAGSFEAAYLALLQHVLAVHYNAAANHCGCRLMYVLTVCPKAFWRLVLFVLYTVCCCKCMNGATRAVCLVLCLLKLFRGGCTA